MRVMQKGQALLLVLLSMAVILTVVLSILSSSITDITLSSKEEEATRAFSAAEAGIEQALIIGSTGQTQIGDASFDAQVTDLASATSTFNYPVEVASGDIATLQFCPPDADCFTGRQLQVCWGKPGTPNNAATTPAIEVSVFYAVTPGDLSSAKVVRQTFDPNAARRATNFFSAPGGVCTIENVSYAFSASVDMGALGVPAGSWGIPGGLQSAKIRLLYNTNTNQSVGFNVNFPGNALLPSQGQKIESVGTAGEATRKVEVYRLIGEVPSVFETAIYVPGGISK